MAHVQVNPPLFVTLTTLSCLLYLTTCHILPQQNAPDYYMAEGDEDPEEEKVDFKEVVQIRARNKRYPIHLDPHFGSAFKFQGGECPKSADGQTKFFCPFPNHKTGRYVCLEEWELCDGVKNCPDASDETPSNCLFYKVMQSQFHSLVESQRERDEAERRARTLDQIRQMNLT